ncbi:MAG TPA: hypothetical protein VGY32_04050, partial [Solirubrobacteraceae bacterium]|nr:hypothetical protein [Solirubrobacteraceae bacterium]
PRLKRDVTSFDQHGPAYLARVARREVLRDPDCAERTTVVLVTAVRSRLRRSTGDGNRVHKERRV